jgi:type IV secretion system protein VirD4
MNKNILPPDKLTLSERLLYVTFCVTAMAIVLMAIAAFLHHPQVVFGVAALWVCVEMRKRRLRRGQTSGIHGTGHFASDVEIAAAGLTGPTQGLIVGTLPERSGRHRKPNLIDILRVPMKNAPKLRAMFSRFLTPGIFGRRRSLPNLIRVPSSDKYAHIACYMPTGVGKTWRVVIPNLLTDSSNCVVYDPSGETVRETAEHRHKQFGHEIHVVDPFRVCGGRYSDRVNVLDMVSRDDPGLFDYCNHLSHALVVDKPESRQEPIWHAGNILATGFALHAIMLIGGEKFRSLLSLGELLNGKRLHELAESLMDHPDSALRRRAQQMLNFKGRTLDSLLSTMSAEHGWMDSPAFSDALSSSTFSVRDLFRRPMTLYIVIPGNRAIESAPFLRVLITAILYAAFETGPDIRRPAVRLYLDEIATLGKLDMLMTLYTQGRKYSLKSVNFFQSVGQVSEIVGSPDKVQTFRSQMSGELFKAKDLQSAKEISEWIGNTTVQTVSTSWQNGTNGGWSNTQAAHPSASRSGGWSQSNNRTVSETGVPVIRPEEILQLSDREAIFVSAGIPPVRLNILGTDDLRRCADARAAKRQQKFYLRRVRFHAALMMLGFVAPCTAAGIGLIAEGMDQWSRPSMPIGPTTGPMWQPVPVQQMKYPRQRVKQWKFQPQGVRNLEDE